MQQPPARKPIGPADATLRPRFAGPDTFARLPELRDVDAADIAIIGIPFDTGVSYRPGARFGPRHIRGASKLLRPYNPAQAIAPFDALQVADAGDIAVSPFNIPSAISEIEGAVRDLTQHGTRLLTLGGDHTIALPLLRAAAANHGPIGVVHFDAHLDTWDTYFGAPYTHGTPFRRAAEEELLDPERCVHVGIRGPLYAAEDLTDDATLGFQIVTADSFTAAPVASLIEKIARRLGTGPVYVSVDIDVLDPAFAPATGTPEAGGLSSRELLAVLRSLAGLQIVGADIVEVAPPYDHAEITGIIAAHVGYEMLSAMAQRHGERS